MPTPLKLPFDFAHNSQTQLCARTKCCCSLDWNHSGRHHHAFVWNAGDPSSFDMSVTLMRLLSEFKEPFLGRRAYLSHTSFVQMFWWCLVIPQ